MGLPPFRPAFTIDQVRTFVVVAEHQHVTRAAEVISLSQGAVTQQVKLLERALGVRLFERVGRNVQLTDAGRAVLEASRAAMRSVESIEEAARSSRSPDLGSVRVGASQTAATYYLPRPLAAFVERHPKVQIRVTVGTTDAIAEQVRSGALDCGLVAGVLRRSPLVQVHVVTDEVLIVASARHRLGELKRPARDDLLSSHYLSREPSSETEQVARRMLGDVYDLLSRIELGRMEAVRAALLAGAGFTAMPVVAVEEELKDGRLVRLPIRVGRRSIRAIRRPVPGSPTLQAFWSELSRPPADAAGPGLARRDPA